MLVSWMNSLLFGAICCVVIAVDSNPERRAVPAASANVKSKKANTHVVPGTGSRNVAPRKPQRQPEGSGDFTNDLEVVDASGAGPGVDDEDYYNQPALGSDATSVSSKGTVQSRTSVRPDHAGQPDPWSVIEGSGGRPSPLWDGDYYDSPSDGWWYSNDPTAGDAQSTPKEASGDSEVEEVDDRKKALIPDAQQSEEQTTTTAHSSSPSTSIASSNMSTAIVPWFIITEATPPSSTTLTTTTTIPAVTPPFSEPEQPKEVETNPTLTDGPTTLEPIPEKPPMGTIPSRKTPEPFLKSGILAAIIGGAIVGLLAAILLVMFIVYRMRKKDEGSYALDEPKAPPSSYPYAYHKAPPREFYA